MQQIPINFDSQSFDQIWNLNTQYFVLEDSILTFIQQKQFNILEDLIFDFNIALQQIIFYTYFIYLWGKKEKKRIGIFIDCQD